MSDYVKKLESIRHQIAKDLRRRLREAANCAGPTPADSFTLHTEIARAACALLSPEDEKLARDDVTIFCFQLGYEFSAEIAVKQGRPVLADLAGQRAWIRCGNAVFDFFDCSEHVDTDGEQYLREWISIKHGGLDADEIDPDPANEEEQTPYEYEYDNGRFFDFSVQQAIDYLADQAG